MVGNGTIHQCDNSKRFTVNTQQNIAREAQLNVKFSNVAIICSHRADL